MIELDTWEQSPDANLEEIEEPDYVGVADGRQEGDFTLQAVSEVARELRHMDLLQNHRFTGGYVICFPHSWDWAFAEFRPQKVISQHR